MANKSYLGDAVYVDFDGYALVLTTDDGITITNRIVLEPDVYKSLTEYVTRLGEPKPEIEDRILEAEFEILPATPVDNICLVCRTPIHSGLESDLNGEIHAACQLIPAGEVK